MNNFVGSLNDISLTPSTATLAIGCILLTSYIPLFAASRKSKVIATSRDLDSPSSLLGKSKTRASDKVDELHSNAKAFKALSLEERLQLVLEIEACLPALGKRNWIEGEMAVMKFLPDDVTNDNKSKSSTLMSSPTFVKNSAGVLRFSIASHVSKLLKSIKTNLEYQISISNGEIVSKQNSLKPQLLKEVTEKTIGGRPMAIHGPIEIPLISHKFEIWASKDNDDGNEMSTENTDEKDTEDDILGIELIMGAGNQAILTFSDILDILFTPTYRPVLLKLHPLRNHLFEVCSEVFKPLIDRGFFHIVIDEGIAGSTALLCNPKVKHVRMTGGMSAAKKIQETLEESRPHMSKEEIQSMFTTELGCVTPWIMSPGTYTDIELRNAAEYIATSKKVNAGCNCLSANAVIFPSEWSQKEDFKKLLRETLEKSTTDPLYYPGSAKRNHDIVNHYGGIESKRVEQISGPNIDRDGGDESDFAPVYVVDCGTYGKDDYDNHALLNESFGPVLATVELPGGADMDYRYLIDQVVPFLNNKENIFGSLSCSIIYPESAKDAIALKEVIGALNYGTIALNTWSLFGYAGIPLGGIWGGSKYEVLGQSGRGMIGNIFQIKNVEKCVVRSESLAAKIILQKNVLIPAFVTNILYKMTVARGTVDLIKSFFLSQKE